MTSIASALTSSLNMRQNMFSRIDANADGKVSKDEFVSARPKGVSDSQASELFGKLDTNGTGALTEEHLLAGMAKNKSGSDDSASLGGNLSSDVLSAILQIVQQIEGSTTDSASGTPTIGNHLSAGEMFAKMDTDGNGNVSKDEFVAARPEGISEDQALEFFKKIDTEDSGSITLAQFEGGMKAGPGGPPPAGGGGSTETVYDSLDTNEDGKVSIAELLAGQTENADKGEVNMSKDLLAQLVKAVQAYTANVADNKVKIDPNSSLLAA